MSKILKTQIQGNFSIITPDIKPEEKEIFKSLLQSFASKKTHAQISLNELRKKAEKEGFKIGYEKGFRKGYEEGILQGHQQGFEEGYEKGKNQAQKEYEKLKVSLEEKYNKEIKEIEIILNNLRSAIKNIVLDLDKQILSLALKIAQKILLKEVSIDRELSLRIIREALNYVAEGVKVEIKINPEDYEYLKNNLSHLNKPSAKIVLIPDKTIHKGGVFIETPLGIIDATLEKRWEKILKVLEEDES